MNEGPRGHTHVSDLTLPIAMQLVLTHPGKLKELGREMVREMRATIASESIQLYPGSAYSACFFLEEGHLVLETTPPKLMLSATITTRTEGVDAKAAMHFLRRRLEPRRQYLPRPMRRYENAR